jgi:hypothetical protein
LSTKLRPRLPAAPPFANRSSHLTIQHSEAVPRPKEASISRWPCERGRCRTRTGLFLTARRLLEREATPFPGTDGDASVRSPAVAANVPKVVDSLGAHGGLAAIRLPPRHLHKPNTTASLPPARRRRSPRRSTVSTIHSTALNGITAAEASELQEQQLSGGRRSSVTSYAAAIAKCSSSRRSDPLPLPCPGAPEADAGSRESVGLGA